MFSSRFVNPNLILYKFNPSLNENLTLFYEEISSCKTYATCIICEEKEREGGERAIKISRNK